LYTKNTKNYEESATYKNNISNRL